MTAQSKTLEYCGKLEFQPKPDRKARVFPYLPEPSLIEAVNLAIALDRPLLIQGEPGCGKTLLARAIAYEFSQRYLKGYAEWPFFCWNVKSNSTAQEGRYTYDALGKLRDAQLVGTPQLEQFLDDTQRQKLIDRLSDPEGYIKWGTLGEALKFCDGSVPFWLIYFFRWTVKADSYSLMRYAFYNMIRFLNGRPILLIDEIDKADPDFPNDLLLEIEEKRFVVTQTGEEVRANPDYAPIVFVTSNAQKQLPDAFLRRCLYHYIEFPSIEALQEIVIARFGKLWKMDLLDRTLRRFLKLRRLMEAEKGEFGKKVSTSELLDWIEALRLYASDDEDLDRLLGKNQLPYANTLIKTKDDRELVKYMEEEGTDDDD